MQPVRDGQALHVAPVVEVVEHLVVVGRRLAVDVTRVVPGGRFVGLAGKPGDADALELVVLALVVRIRELAHGAHLTRSDYLPRMTEKQRPDRNLAIELVRVTEAAALAASRWMGRGDKNGADGAAVDAMRIVLDSVPMDGIVVIGEGEKDEAPMLYNGERVGDGSATPTDVAVDPIDGTTLTALGRGNALAVIAVSERGTMFDPGPCVYMEKIAVGPEGVGVIDLTRTVAENIEALAKAKGTTLPRHHRRDPRPGPPRRPHRARCGRPAPASASSPTATWPAPSRRRGRTPAPTSCSASAARPRA